ncbi:MAG: SOS response-associated peptidase [Gammaproteobacteria bacterium]|nr:SOS response-associated peptidase [Gammaproteobacteria bacterium]
MCGRFANKETPASLAEYFQADGQVDFSPSYNIAPSSRIVTVTADAQDHRHLKLMKWGLIPSWAKDPSIGNKLANARGETVAEKPSFRTAFRTRRCIIPATGFFEWKADGGKKYPWFISLKSGEPLAMAGIWEAWRSEAGESIETCCIITTDCNELMQPIHDRMPVLLNRDQWSNWLSPSEKQPANLHSMIRPFSPDLMQAWPVTRELNRVGVRDDAGLIQSVE